MSIIGSVKHFVVEIRIRNGAFLSTKGDRRNYFISNKNINYKDKDNKVFEGSKIKGRIVGKRKLKNGKISYQVSTKLLDKDTYSNDSFNEKLNNFLKDSEDRQKTIRKNRERKFLGNKKRKKYF